MKPQRSFWGCPPRPGHPWSAPGCSWATAGLCWPCPAGEGLCHGGTELQLEPPRGRARSVSPISRVYRVRNLYGGFGL